MVILAVDLGKTRTGIAVSDKDESFAFPRAVIKEYNRERLYGRIVGAAKENKAELIVLGLPKNMNGSEGFKAEESHSAKEEIEKLCDIPVELYDERCTTLIAHQSLQNCGVKAKNRKDIVDSVAATVILESYLEFRKNRNNI